MTTIVNRSPRRDLESLDRQMHRLLGEIGFSPVVIPASDVYETEDEFVVELDVPGFEKEELGVEVSDHRLTVKGERKKSKEDDEKAFRLRERLERRFERRFELPAEADTEQVRAKFVEGVLEIHTPKLEAVKPKHIEITKS